MCNSKKLVIVFLFVAIHAVEVFGAQEPWTGIDVSIVGKYATSFGRPPRDPYINTDRGDLLLCLFTLSGVIGGFVIGYNWHKLMAGQKGEKVKR